MLARFGTKWAEEERHPVIPQNVFLLLLRYLLVVSLKNLRNKAVLTIVIGLENILCWSLVKSALDKEDNNAPVYFPFFNFLFVILVCDVSV